jgi:hypothetical protein
MIARRHAGDAEAGGRRRCSVTIAVAVCQYSGFGRLPVGVHPWAELTDAVHEAVDERTPTGVRR